MLHWKTSRNKLGEKAYKNLCINIHIYIFFTFYIFSWFYPTAEALMNQTLSSLETRDQQQDEETEHQSNITQNKTEMTRRKLAREAAEGSTAALKQLQEHLASTAHSLHVTFSHKNTQTCITTTNHVAKRVMIWWWALVRTVCASLQKLYLAQNHTSISPTEHQSHGEAW